MAGPALEVRSVAVIGAGISGVSAAIHLARVGLDVKVFERTSRAGGVWVHDPRAAVDAAYPSDLPSIGDAPDWGRLSQRTQYGRDGPMIESNDENAKAEAVDDETLRLHFAPPGPCYESLKNNVSTHEMEISCQTWDSDSAEVVPHNTLAEYVSNAAVTNNVLDRISFNTRVEQVEDAGEQWMVRSTHLHENDGAVSLTRSIEKFDAVVVAVGHYHACNIPPIPGLADWKRRFPTAVQHSKLYRSPTSFKDKTVLLIGAGVSSVDIAKDLGTSAKRVYQSSRGGMYDLPAHILPENALRIGPIQSFDLSPSTTHLPDPVTTPSTSGKVILQSGQELCGIDHVIVCTGYHVSLPFMRQYHADGVHAADANSTVLVTDGQQTHNLHKDIWYIPKPTLAFIGVPYHVATFSAFEFQAMALAAVFVGQVPLPAEEHMRREYDERTRNKGAGRTFHSLKEAGAEIGYVQELVDMVNRNREREEFVPMVGHTKKWMDSYERRKERQAILFAPRDLPSKAHLIVGC